MAQQYRTANADHVVLMVYSVLSHFINDAPSLNKHRSLGSGVGRFEYLSIVADINSPRIEELYWIARKTVDETDCKGLNDKASKCIPFLATSLAVHNGIEYNDTDRKYNFMLRPLDHYITNGGVCTEFSMATLAVLQRFRIDGYIDGELKLMLNKPKGEKLGHAWVLHKGEGNDRTIIDSTHNLVINYINNGIYPPLPRTVWSPIPAEGSERNAVWDYFDNSECKRKSMMHTIYFAGPLLGVCTTLAAFAGSLQYKIAFSLAAGAVALKSSLKAVRAHNDGNLD